MSVQTAANGSRCIFSAGYSIWKYCIVHNLLLLYLYTRPLMRVVTRLTPSLNLPVRSFEQNRTSIPLRAHCVVLMNPQGFPSTLATMEVVEAALV